LTIAGVFSEKSAQKAVREIMQGLAELHAHELSHGRLKPEQFLFIANSGVKIGSFGQSQPHESPRSCVDPLTDRLI
jgi:serine/threonine protein kinase